MIGVSEQRGFSEELATTRRVKDYQMVINSAPDQAQPTAFDLVDRRRWVALPEERLAWGEDTDSTPSLKAYRQRVGKITAMI